jgi:hypothetical protein
MGVIISVVKLKETILQKRKRSNPLPQNHLETKIGKSSDISHSISQQLNFEFLLRNQAKSSSVNVHDLHGLIVFQVFSQLRDVHIHAA